MAKASMRVDWQITSGSKEHQVLQYLDALGVGVKKHEILKAIVAFFYLDVAYREKLDLDEREIHELICLLESKAMHFRKLYKLDLPPGTPSASFAIAEEDEDDDGWDGNLEDDEDEGAFKF